MDISCIYPCKCYLLYSQKTAILTIHIWEYKQFYVHVYFLFFNYAVQILYVKPLLLEYRKVIIV